jgi:glycosyltransferase involved in cell wall biosynthesis
MRIALINLTGGGASGGYRKYLRNVLPLLARHPQIESILCASPPALAVPGWFEPMDKVAWADCDPFRVPGRGNRRLHAVLDEFRPNVVFVPLERHFRHHDVPCVCMVRNMLPLARMRHATVHEDFRNRMQKAMARRAVQRSTRVIAVSRYVSDYLETEWRVGPERIGLVYHGVAVPPAGGAVLPVGVPAGWAGDFLLAAGMIEPFRDVGVLLAALGRLKQDGRDVKAVIAGAVRPAMLRYYHDMHHLARRLGIEEDVCWAGDLDGGEMEWCYGNARAVVMTSRVEACPNTALEAMSHGCAIVSTDSPPMPEMFEQTASYYHAGDSDELAARLAEVVNGDAAAAGQRRKAAAERAILFSWARTVAGTVRELQRARG